MKRDERLERRLQDFYGQVPDVEDALPFKDYLLKHEDSRMAWYLLGKQYAAKGEEAKANYCFHQSGEIFEAFEAKPAPAAPNLSTAGRRKGGRSRKALLLGALSLALAATGVAFPAWTAFAPDRERGEAVTVSAPASPDRRQNRAPSGDPPPAVLPPSPTIAVPTAPGLVAAAAESDAAGRAALGELLIQPPDRKPLVLIDSPRIGGWSDWLSGGDPVAEVVPGEASDPGSSLVNWFDEAWCNCLAAETPEPLRQWMGDWKQVQEEKLALVSAVRQYRIERGRLPQSPDDLAGDYPNNRMAGWTEAMDAWFGQLTDPQAEKDKTRYPLPDWPTEAGGAGQAQGGRAVPAGEWRDLTEQPLEIIVDKTHHRLAVVSGNVLLRNYAVGLGGSRTPEGEFIISEKVRDPRSEPEGVFGTRGMTLSDTRYGIHGTDQPGSIGRDESLGCVRMAQEDIEELYDLVPIGTKVTIMREGLPVQTRVPSERFRLPQTKDETNPRKVYDWLG